MTELFLDYETRSRLDLIKVGTYRYASDPSSTNAIIAAYAIDDGPIKVVDMLTAYNLEPAIARIPDELRDALTDPSAKIIAHNAVFDRLITEHVLGLKNYVPLKRWRCSMARCLAHGLPGRLADACRAIAGPFEKLEEGKDLIRLFSLLNEAGEFNRPEDHATDWNIFKRYARRDVEAMRWLWYHVPGVNYPNNPFERELYTIDQKANDAGLPIDLSLVTVAQKAVNMALAEYNRQIREVTNGAVNAVTEVAALKAWMKREGVNTNSLARATVALLLEDPATPGHVKQALIIRSEAAKTSTAKLATVSNALSDDGRLRGTLQIYGASRTGRWAGRMLQPQNLPRPDPDIDPTDVIESLANDTFEQDYNGRSLRAISSCIRGIIAPPAWSKLVVSDLSNIEGRMLAWLAGEQWKLEAFKAYDLGEGPDLYKASYARSFGVPVDSVDKDQRQIGKVQELALGYEGGVGAFKTFADVYGVDLDSLYPAVWNGASDEYKEKSERALRWYVANKSFPNLSHRAIQACSIIKYAWRDAHPATVLFWADVEKAARSALLHPGKTFTVGKVKFKLHRFDVGFYLLCRMPSGSFLTYYEPALKRRKETHVDPDSGNTVETYVSRLTFRGTDSREGPAGFRRIPTYSGKLVENITQKGARDILAEAMVRAAKAGYKPILTAHDEDVTEVPRDAKFSHRELSKILAETPAWAEGLPLAAEGYEAERYRK